MFQVEGSVAVGALPIVERPVAVVAVDWEVAPRTDEVAIGVAVTRLVAVDWAVAPTTEDVAMGVAVDMVIRCIKVI
jgi:hypothetical protein